MQTATLTLFNVHRSQMLLLLLLFRGVKPAVSPKIGVTVKILPAPLWRRGHKHHLNEKPSEKWLWDLVLGNLGMFDGVPAELQMVPNGRNGRNGRCNRWIPLALGLLLFTRSYCCSVVTVNSNNTVHGLTLPCSKFGRGPGAGLEVNTQSAGLFETQVLS